MTLLDTALLLFINIIHLMVILIILIVPFSGSNYYLFSYIILVPFIILHWVLNNNSCCLTLMEQRIRERITGEPINTHETYMHKLIGPIYDFKKDNNDLSFYIYTASIILWLSACGGLYKNYKNNKINSFTDLFII